MEQGKPNQTTADFDTILRRLEVKNEQLDRELEAMLRGSRLSRKTLNQAVYLARQHSAERLAQAERNVEQQLTDSSETDWEHISRPSLEALSRDFGARLLRV